jgi:hypothetical protein
VVTPRRWAGRGLLGYVPLSWKTWCSYSTL